jgi:excisionase family DNA binding protein
METILQFKQSDFIRFLDDLKTHVTKEIRSIQRQDNAVEEPINPKAAAAYLKISLKTYYNRIKSGDIPERIIHRNGKKVHLFKSELKQFLKES